MIGSASYKQSAKYSLFRAMPVIALSFSLDGQTSYGMAKAYLAAYTWLELASLRIAAFSELRARVAQELPEEDLKAAKALAALSQVKLNSKQ